MIDKILKEVLLVCCVAFETDIGVVLSKKRKAELVHTRLAFITIIKEKFNFSNHQIGKFLNMTDAAVGFYMAKSETNKWFLMMMNQIRINLKDYCSY